MAIAAFAWPLLVEAGGLAVTVAGRLHLTADGRAALERPPHQTLRALWESWLVLGGIDEFTRVDGLKGQQAAGGRNLTAVAPRRLAVARALAGCPTDGWILAEDFLRHMRVERHTFAVVHNPTLLHIGKAVHKTRLEGYDDDDVWLVVQGRYALCLLLEYAAPLGLIDVAYGEPGRARDDYHGLWGSGLVDSLSRYDGLGAISVTALGAYCLGEAAAYAGPG